MQLAGGESPQRRSEVGREHSGALEASSRRGRKERWDTSSQNIVC